MTTRDNDRRLRVQYPGALYHITSRGVERRDIFLDDEDRATFFALAERTVHKYGWLIYAVALMSNHFHLYFRTPLPNLSRGAQSLLGGYAQHFNRRHGRTGHLFEGRFRGHVIESTAYGWNTSRYVHLNPYPALADHPADWRWSSYRGYCRPQWRLPWVCYDGLLAAWNGDFGGSAETYCQFVEAGKEQPRRSPLADAIDGWILGDDTFAARIRSMVSPGSQEPDATRSRSKPLPLSLIIDATCEEFGIPRCALRVKRSRHPARSIVAQLGREASSATLQQIAAELGLARRDCVPKLLRKAQAADANSELVRHLEAVRARLRPPSGSPPL